jgi:ketosteroid isomerase-like protein
MSEVHPNVTRYLESIRAFNDSDVHTALKYTAEDVVYRVPGRSPIAGEFRCLSAYYGALRHARHLTRDTLSLRPYAVLANDEYILVYGRIRAERAGRQLDSDHCVMFRFAGEKIVEARTIPVDQYAFDDFWRRSRSREGMS